MFVESRGHRIHFEEVGAGPALLFLHGFTMRGYHWAALGYVRRFMRTHRVITMDLLGHGDSDKPHDPAAYRLRGLATDVVSVLDHLRIGRAHLWGITASTRIALRVAKYFPERVASLVLAGSGGSPGVLSERETASLTARGESLQRGDWAAFLASTGDAAEDDRNESLRRSGVPMVSREDVMERNDPLALAAMWLGVRDSLSQPGSEDALDIAALRTPMLLYAGSEDFGIASARASAAAAGTVCRELPGFNHFSGFTLAVDQASALVEEFLLTVPA